MKRYIKVPQDIQLTDLVTHEPLLLPDQKPWVISFRGFICGTILKDQKFGKTGAAVISGSVIRAAVEKDAEVISLEGEDYDLLKTVLETPDTPYRPEIAIQIISFFRAILDATTTDPRSSE
jgi:hypothetical protein